MGIQINGQTDTISSTDGSLNIGGTVTVNVTGDATGLTGTPNITVGIVTASNVVVSGDLTVNGTTTTLDTVLTEVDKLEVGANNTTVGVAITQSGSGDILRLYDGATQVVTVKDGGSVGIGTDNPGSKLHIISTNNVPLRVESPTADSYINFVNSQNTNGYIGYETQALTFYTNNTEKLRITSGGNVGINTTVMDANLEVHTSASKINAQTIKTSAGAGGYAGLAFMAGQTSAGREKAALYFQETNGGAHYTGDLVFALNSNSGSAAQVSTSDERLRITSSGNVGINTTTFPANGTNLKVSNGTISRLLLDKTGTNARSFSIGNGGTYINLYDETADVERLRITSNGNVRFQANNTTSNFTVSNITGTTYVLDTTTPSAVGTGGRIVFGSTYYTQGNTMGTAYIGSYKENAPSNGANEYNHSLVFGTQSSNGLGERLRIDSSGNVGINSAIPAAKLDIIGGNNKQLQVTGTEADIWLKSTGPGTIWRILGSTGNNTHKFRIYDETNSLDRFGIDSSGRVTMPYQPYARASSTITQASTNAIPLNSNSSYNYSRGGITISGNKFTVPVAGAYVIGYHHLGNSGSGACQIEIRHNGTYIPGTRTQDTNSTNDSFGTQTVKELNANDYIEFWVIAGSSHGNQDYNSMWIWLLG